MSYAQGFSRLSFEAIRLLQGSKGLFLCSFIYGAQTFSDLEICEKAISCPQRKRLRLLPAGPGGAVSLPSKQVTPLMHDYLPSQVPARFASACVRLLRYFLENKQVGGAGAATRGSATVVGADWHRHPKVLGVPHPSPRARGGHQACSPVGL